MERIGKLMIITGLAYLLISCSDKEDNLAVHYGDPNLSPASGLRQTTQINVKYVKRVMAARNIIGQPTASIVLGSNSRNHFELTLLRSNIKEGYTVRSDRFSHPEVLLSTNWYGNRFIQSDQHPTAVSLTIGEITPEQAVLYLSATLVDPSTGGYLTLSPSMITVRGAHLRQLIATP
ncbi:hypothetical protein [Pseudomonas sp. RT6P73]